VVSKW